MRLARRYFEICKRQGYANWNPHSQSDKSKNEKEYHLYEADPDMDPFLCTPKSRSGANHEDFYFGTPPRLEPETWPTLDHNDCEVVIKLVKDSELTIICQLNSEPMRSNRLNPRIELWDILQFQDFTFMVMPRWVLQRDYVDYYLKVPPEQGLSFLHNHRFAHYDIHHFNAGHGKDSGSHFWLGGAL
ncbi:hypothetical protein K435DRAFT_881472 [Dendrothele bispora CBS 962.96]|uniref:Protein kinase domain-containing protein n=1 Tax=Dendrothele bispora (strain CBS 962.96) TaxID=1314807 RepID=A0A4S8KI98_DENBC|nr:hypothetical protein K435DRAFT_881472 [Dendrothele bispora CBS 962.96]